MRSLQFKIALIIVGSMMAVMLIATLATAFVVFNGDASRMIDPMADHIAVSAELIENGGTLSPHRHEQIADAPATGEPRADLTDALATALAGEGKTGKVLVTIDPEHGQPVASYQVSDGRWTILSFPRPMSPPPELWAGLASWLILVLIGVVAVALFTARRVTQPFSMLERAIASVGADGVLPHVPETGTGEARHTATALNRLSDRLKTSMESRMRLVAAAGHDLRTPMTRMRLRAEFLSEDERTSWIADLDELELIADSAIRLVREEGAREDQTVIELDAVVAETVKDLKSSQLPAAMTEAVPVRVMAGPLSLRRALRNLITNAATHGGGARVAVTAAGEAAQVVIDDDGPGIPLELIPQVFEPFFRVDQGRRKAIRGAGLGLAIAKEIIERFGGSIEIENRPGGGLRQTITLKQVLL